MSNSSNSTLCNLFTDSDHYGPKYRCEIGADRETSSKYGIDAGYYIIIVILFYGTSAVFLIASRINRKHKKIVEDRQIDSYLKEYQIVKETSSRDNYRNLKRSMIAKLSKMGVSHDSHESNARNASTERSSRSPTHTKLWPIVENEVTSVDRRNAPPCHQEYHNYIEASPEPAKPHRQHHPNGNPPTDPARIHGVPQMAERALRTNKTGHLQHSTTRIGTQRIKGQPTRNTLQKPGASEIEREQHISTV